MTTLNTNRHLSSRGILNPDSNTKTTAQQESHVGQENPELRPIGVFSLWYSAVRPQNNHSSELNLTSAGCWCCLSGVFSYLRWFLPCPHWRCWAVGRSEVQGGAVAAGWGPGVVEGPGTAGQGTRAPWRQMNQEAPMKGSGFLSPRMRTGTGWLQVSPPGRTLCGHQRVEGYYFQQTAEPFLWNMDKLSPLWSFMPQCFTTSWAHYSLCYMWLWAPGEGLQIICTDASQMQTALMCLRCSFLKTSFSIKTNLICNFKCCDFMNIVICKQPKWTGAPAVTVWNQMQSKTQWSVRVVFPQLAWNIIHIWTQTIRQKIALWL